jgi:hypothetical protein
MPSLLVREAVAQIAVRSVNLLATYRLGSLESDSCDNSGDLSTSDKLTALVLTRVRVHPPAGSDLQHPYASLTWQAQEGMQDKAASKSPGNRNTRRNSAGTIDEVCGCSSIHSAETFASVDAAIASLTRASSETVASIHRSNCRFGARHAPGQPHRGNNTMSKSTTRYLIVPTQPLAQKSPIAAALIGVWRLRRSSDITQVCLLSRIGTLQTPSAERSSEARLDISVHRP